MLMLETLLTRIRAEYREMPGLRLTFAQACRLWQLDAATCEALLQQLINDRFLYKTNDGSYVASARQAKAQLRSRVVLPRSA